MPMHTSAPYSVGALYLDFGPHRPLYIAEIGDQDLPPRDVVKSYFDSNSSVMGANPCANFKQQLQQNSNFQMWHCSN